MRKLVMGMTCYGKYVDTFYRYCLPSLMAKGNLPALQERYEVHFSIHTDTASAEDFKDFPGVITESAAEDKYAMIGRHQAYDLGLAKSMGADYHLLMPDFVYSENCFAGVLKAVDSGHKAIARLVISTVQEDMQPELDRPRSAVDLASLSLKHIHPGVVNWLVRRDGYYPNTHVLAWHAGNTLRMCSPHATPVYIANEAIKVQPTTLPLDSILDMVIDGPIYYPKPEDGIVIIEISPLASRAPDNKRVNLNEFMRIFRWNTQNSAVQQSLFLEETVDRVSSAGDYTDEEIKRQKELIIGALKS